MLPFVHILRNYALSQDRKLTHVKFQDIVLVSDNGNGSKIARHLTAKFTLLSLGCIVAVKLVCFLIWSDEPTIPLKGILSSR